jgi:hypothetical protein
MLVALVLLASQMCPVGSVSQCERVSTRWSPVFDDRASWRSDATVQAPLSGAL